MARRARRRIRRRSRHTADSEAPLHRRGPLFGQQPLLLLRHLRLRHLVRNPRRRGQPAAPQRQLRQFQGPERRRAGGQNSLRHPRRHPLERCLVQHQRRALLLRPYRRGDPQIADRHPEPLRGLLRAGLLQDLERRNAVRRDGRLHPLHPGKDQIQRPEAESLFYGPAYQQPAGRARRQELASGESHFHALLPRRRGRRDRTVAPAVEFRNPLLGEQLPERREEPVCLPPAGTLRKMVPAAAGTEGGAVLQPARRKLCLRGQGGQQRRPVGRRGFGARLQGAPLALPLPLGLPRLCGAALGGGLLHLAVFHQQEDFRTAARTGADQGTEHEAADPGPDQLLHEHLPRPQNSAHAGRRPAETAQGTPARQCAGQCLRAPDREERGAHPAHDQPTASVPRNREPEDHPEPPAGRSDPLHRQHLLAVRVLRQQEGDRNRLQLPV